MVKTKISACLFGSLPVNTRFVSAKTFPLTGKVFKKIERIPPKKKWSIYSNAIMEGDDIAIHMEDTVVCIPESEFPKFMPGSSIG